jgi:hypothetical protein
MYDPGVLSDPEQLPPEDGAPVRVCPNCSAQSQTSSDTCPHCGASFIRSRRMRARRRIGGWSRGRKVVTLGLIAAIVGAAVAVGVVVKVNHDNTVAAEHREEQEEREAIAAAKLAKEQLALREQHEEEKTVREEESAERAVARIELEYGKESVTELEKDITNSANEEAEEGFSETVSSTNCEADGGKIDTSLAAQNFHCIAVTSEEGDLENGYRYSGTINYVKGSLSWRFGGE